MKRLTWPTIQPWVVCLTAALFFFYAFLDSAMINSISVDLLRSFKIGSTQLGWLSASYFMVGIIIVIPAGLMLDKFSPKKLILIALCIDLIGTTIFATAPTFGFALLGRALAGFAAFSFLGCLALVKRWFPARRNGLIIGLIGTMGMLGGSIAQAPFSALVSHLGWRLAIGVNILFGFGVLAMVFLLVSDKPANYSIKLNNHSLSFLASLKAALKTPVVWFAGIFCAVLNLPLNILGGTWNNIFLTQGWHISLNKAAMMSMIIFFGMMIGSPLMGLLADAFRSKRWVMFVSALIAIIFALLIIYASRWGDAPLLVFYLGLSLAASAQILVYPYLTAVIPVGYAVTATSVVVLLVYIVTAIADPLFGWLVSVTWNGKMINGVPIYSLANYQMALLALVVAMCIAMLLSLKLTENKAK